ncbi:hypothetical protein [Brucella pseudogrignonensis]|uniref:hypothetical protein n=1 Tax=Brucella pseudogrignonensis TaxID=419475 RepID=UPI0011B04C53|nr:hypothetical protein [Brucella pseudogrignonensis]MQP42357.1 hypothetical protein [Ochrobactrum sp. MYb237]
MVDEWKGWKDEYSPILTCLGGFLFRWNALEQTALNLMLTIVGRSKPAQILAAHLGSVALSNSLKTMANECVDARIQAPLLHAIVMIERLRVYRNFFIHGFNMIGSRSLPTYGADGTLQSLEFIEAIGWAESIKANGKIVQHDVTVDTHMLETLAAHTAAADNYLVQIHHFLKQLETQPDIEVSQVLKDKPPLPDVMKKPLREPEDN